MSAGGSKPRVGLSGRYGIVGHRSGAATTAPLGQVKETEDGTRRRELVDDDLLDEESRNAIEADDYVIFGRASVEQYDEDEPSQMLTMEALSDSLPQLYSDGIISRRHKDIPVGEVAPKYELEESASIEVGDEVLNFEAGEKLQTQIVDEGDPRPGDGGVAPEDEFWIVARLKNNSEIAKETRLRALAGDLNGFSVTIYAKEWEETDEGQKVTDLDWHAVTIGEEHKIKNKDSRFGVAEYKARFSDAFAGIWPGSNESTSGSSRSSHTTTQHKMTDKFNGQLFSKAGSDLGFDETRLEAASALVEKAEGTDEDALREKADEVAMEYDLNSDSLVATTRQLTGGEAEKADDGGDTPDDVEAILEAVEDSLGAEAAEALRSELESKADDEDDEIGDEDADEAAEGEMKGDDEDDDDDDEDSKSMDDLPDGVVTQDQLEDLKSDMVTADDIEDVKADMMESTEAIFEDQVPELVESVGEKMSTGETDSPSGGSMNDSADYSADIKSSFGTQGDD